MRREVKIGLIGGGFIGRAHALAIHAVNGVFRDRGYQARAHILAEIDAGRAAASAQALGFRHGTADWREAVEASDAVIIAVPSALHREIATHALTRGKPILCEKPVGLSSADAEALHLLARERAVVQAVGFTYARAPLVRHARQLITSGELGLPLTFYGRHCEDYLADADAPFTWRLDASIAGANGALGDLGYHIIGIARLLCGEIETVAGLAETFHRQRQDMVHGRSRKVENEDYAAAVLRFASGARGLIETSRIASGRKMHLAFEVVCTEGTIAFDAERTNEIQIFRKGRRGFETVLIAPDHAPYGDFLPAPGHGLGFNDLKTIELHDFLSAVVTGSDAGPDLGDAVHISRICEAIHASSRSGMFVAANGQPHQKD